MLRLAIPVLPVQPGLGPCLAYGVRRQCRVFSEGEATRCSATTRHQQRFHELCSKYGIFSTATVAAGQHGVGLFLQPRENATPSKAALWQSSHCSNQFNTAFRGPGIAATGTSANSEQLLVSVPLNLVLSCSIPGCSPDPTGTPEELQNLLFSSCCKNVWELQVAALLLWAIRQPSHTAVGGFWKNYSATFIPTLQQQHSLFLWSREELAELQDNQLVNEATDWAQQVQEAYNLAVQPCFDAMSITSNGSYGREGVMQPCSYQEWLWAVAAVQSRAFEVLSRSQGNASRSTSKPQSAESQSDTDNGHPASEDSSKPSSDQAVTESSLFTSAGSGHQVGLVPVLDLANHTCNTTCYHAVDGNTNSFNLYMLESNVTESEGAQVGTFTGADMPKEVLISYGEKSNRQLMEQYGFCLPHNPYDRLQLPKQETGLSDQLWMSHKDIKQAGQLVKHHLMQQSQPDHLDSSTAAACGHSQDASADGQHQTVPTSMIAADKQSVSRSTGSMFAAAHVDAVVASIIAAAGWRNLRQFRQVTSSSTCQRAQQLLSMIQHQLQSYATELREDAHLLEHLRAQADSAPCSGSFSTSSKTPGGQRYLQAVQYRLGHKQLLAAAEGVLVTLLNMHKP